MRLTSEKTAQNVTWLTAGTVGSPSLSIVYYSYFSDNARISLCAVQGLARCCPGMWGRGHKKCWAFYNRAIMLFPGIALRPLLFGKFKTFSSEISPLVPISLSCLYFKVCLL